MIKADVYYKRNLKKILNEGYEDINPRAKYTDGSPAHSMFITQVFEEYDISKNEFPITTLRNTAIKTGINEILWIYQDQKSDLKSAHNRNIHWWDDWNIGNDTIGHRYGYTVKKWNLIDKLLENLKNDPFSRRHIINLYQEIDLNETNGLYPCAYETIWSVRKINEIYYLDLTLIQRSNDYIMAGYINKIQYVSLQMMVASHLKYKIGKFCHFVQNLHIYNRHIDAVNEILNKTSIDIQPILELNYEKSFYEISINDFSIKNIENITKLNSNIEIAI